VTGPILIRRSELLGQILYRLFELGVMFRERQRDLKLPQGFGEIAATLVDLSQSAHGGKVFRGSPEHMLELSLGVIVLSELDQRPPERDTRG
jgi:hypothetical protein